MVRYPGGDFLCAYRSQERARPVRVRPRRRDLPWKSMDVPYTGDRRYDDVS